LKPPTAYPWADASCKSSFIGTKDIGNASLAEHFFIYSYRYS
jgi:hypothetical protein